MAHESIISKDSAFYKMDPYYVFYFKTEIKILNNDEPNIPPIIFPLAMIAIIDSHTREYLTLGSSDGYLFVHSKDYIFNTGKIIDSDEYMIDPQCEGSDDNILSSSNADPTTIMHSMINILNLLKS